MTDKGSLTICSPQSGLDPSSNYGGSVHDREILKRLAELGARIHIPLFGKNQLLEKTPNWIPHHSSLNRYYKLGGLLPTIYSLKKIIDIHKKDKIDLIRLYSPQLGYLGYFIKKFSNLPVVWNIHHLDDVKYENFQLKHFANKMDAITTVSEASRKDILDKCHLSPEKVHVVYNGVDKKYEPHEKDILLSSRYSLEKKRVILFLGKLSPRKNIIFLIDVFKELLRLTERNDVFLIICGEEMESARGYLKILQNHAKSLGIEKHVIFAGRISEEDKLHWLNLCDIFVFPSIKEGFGLAPAEAMACEKPVVASNASSLPEVIIDGVTGFTCSVNEIASFVNPLIELLDNEGLRRRMGQSGRKHVLGNFQWDVAARRTLDIYTDIVNLNRAHDRT